MCGWLARYRRGGLGGLKAKPLFGRPPKLNARDAMDLQHGDAEEPVAAAIPVCIVDARDRGDADQEEIQHHAGRQFRGITCQKPLHRGIERDEFLVRQWLEKEYPQIKAMAKKKRGADIYFGNGAVFSKGRDLGAWLGLVRKQILT